MYLEQPCCESFRKTLRTGKAEYKVDRISIGSVDAIPCIVNSSKAFQSALEPV